MAQKPKRPPPPPDLFEDQPEHIKQLWKEHKKLKRNQARADFWRNKQNRERERLDQY